MARIGIDVVGAEAGLEQLRGGIAFPDRPLSGAEHADAARPALLQRGLEFLRHDVEGFVPGDRRELAVLVVFAVGLAQHRLGQAVMAVHDLGKEIALDAVEAAIDLGLDVAVGGDHAVVLGRDHHAAAGAAEAAGGLVPFQFAGVALGDEIGRERRHRHSAGERPPWRRPRASASDGGRAWVRSWQFSRRRASAGVDGVKDKRSGIDVGQQRDGVERRSERARIERLDHDDELAARIAAIDLAARQRKRWRLRLRRDARAGPGPGCWRFRRRAVPRRGSGVSGAACDEGAAIDSLVLSHGCFSSCSMRGRRPGRAGHHLVDPHRKPVASDRRRRRARASPPRSGTGRRRFPCACGADVQLSSLPTDILLLFSISGIDGIRAVALLQI